MKLEKSFSRPRGSYGNKCGPWKGMENGVEKKLGSFFLEEGGKTRTQNQDRLWKFRSKMKNFESHGKGHGKSWNFKSSKEYEPCYFCIEIS